MSDPSLADVIVRLDRLEAALHQLIEVVRSGSSLRGASPAMHASPAARRPPPQSGGAPSVAMGEAAPGEPPLIHVAPPTARGPMAVAAATELGESLAADYDAYASRTGVDVSASPAAAGIDVPAPSATVQQVLKRVFEAGLMAEPEDTWALMTRLTHPSQMIGPRAVEHFKAFNWHKLRRTAATYLQNGDPGTFVITYCDPNEVTAEVSHVRVFVHAGENRMPVPVGFARDATQGNAWRVTLMSL